MAKIKVYAPNEGYAGTVGGARFEAGVAEVDEGLAEMTYFRKAGYGIGSKVSSDKDEPTVDGEPIDARDYSEPTQVGSKLRDAAVDPEPSDFLPPTNAGKANPHGPRVVAPGIHAVGPAPLRPGEVFVDDTDKQGAEETSLAEAVLVRGDLATSIGGVLDADENMGPLGLSDPGSVSMGVEVAKDVAANEATAGVATMPPVVPKAAPRKSTTRKSTTRARGPRKA